jgi:hypothetical protein
MPALELDGPHTPAGRIGMLVCYDKAFPEGRAHARARRRAGAAFMFAWPCGVTDAARRPQDDRQWRRAELWDRARAPESSPIVASASQTGTLGSLRFGGGARVDPRRRRRRGDRQRVRHRVGELRCRGVARSRARTAVADPRPAPGPLPRRHPAGGVIAMPELRVRVRCGPLRRCYSPSRAVTEFLVAGEARGLRRAQPRRARAGERARAPALTASPARAPPHGSRRSSVPRARTSPAAARS